jgi:hypothetical protein
MRGKQRGQDTGKDTLQDEELRRLETYLQHRLDRAGEGDMKMTQTLIERFLWFVKQARRGCV